MARIRTIKPEFWRHEELSELPEATHMLAAALLNYADDDGFFNANPRLVQAECCPLREPSVSVQDSLISLAHIGYIQLGSGPDGKRYGRIPSFLEHQRINRATPSKIKELDISWDVSLPTHTHITEESLPEGKGRERGKEWEGKGLARSAVADEIPDALQAYNAVAEEVGWPQAQAITHKRKSALKARLADAGGLDGWRAAMAKARASPFLRGESGRDRAHEKWTPDLDFFLQQSSFVKLMEGKYDDRAAAANDRNSDVLRGISRAVAGYAAASS
jgi:hypothetical protein